MEARNQLLGMAMKNPKLIAVRPNGQDDAPEFKLDIDDVRAGALGVSLADVNDVLSTAWGSSYVNNFIENGRVKKVYLQSDAKYRMLPEDINSWYVRNKSGDMVPFSAFCYRPLAVWLRHVWNGITASPLWRLWGRRRLG